MEAPILAPHRWIGRQVGSASRAGPMLSVPVIDAHHHLGGPGTGPDELGPQLAAQRITGTVVSVRRASMHATWDLLALAVDVPFVQGVVGWLDLTADDVGASIQALRSVPGGHALVGVRAVAGTAADPAWLLRADVQRGLACVGDAGLVVDLCVRTHELAAAAQACAALPQVRFVLEHLGGPPITSGSLSTWGGALLELAGRPNVFATLAGFVTEADHQTWSIDDLRHPVELAVDAFGPERLMMGSDWPACLAAGTYDDVIDAIRYLLAELPTYQLEEVRGRTAVRVYRL